MTSELISQYQNVEPHIGGVKDSLEILGIIASIFMSAGALYKTNTLSKSQDYEEKFGADFRNSLRKVRDLIDAIYIVSRSSVASDFTKEASSLKTNYHRYTSPILVIAARIDGKYGTKMEGIVEDLTDMLIAAIMTLVGSAVGEPSLATQIRTIMASIENQLNSLGLENLKAKKSHKKD